MRGARAERKSEGELCAGRDGPSLRQLWTHVEHLVDMQR
jgi:hypothetical protein